MIHTSRLVLRPWREEDREPWAAMGADPEVMEFFPAPLDRSQADVAFDRISTALADRGWGLWAVDAGAGFIGFTGLAPATFDAHFTPAIEVGWRFARSAWGHGYATEAARAALDYGFEQLDLDEVVSFTSVTNTRSRAVMQRVGMTHDAVDDFDNPNVPEGNPLRPHVLYRARRP
jgi:ribosomal-protein-alanine N-acetyltransferase